MERTLIAELGEHVDERVEVRGWVQAVRDQKRDPVRDRARPKRARAGRAAQVRRAQRAQRTDLDAHERVRGHRRRKLVADERVKLGGLELQIESLRSSRSPSPSCPSPPSRRSTSASTGATSTCATPIGA